MSYLEQILEAKHHETTAVRPLSSYLKKPSWEDDTAGGVKTNS